MKIKLFIIFLFFSPKVFSQNANSLWVFGDSAGIDFSLGLPVTFASGMDGRGSCANIADSNGNLLFYAFTRAGFAGRTTWVFSHNHQLMQNGDSIVGEGWYNELTIIPVIDSANIYYLFSTGLDISLKGLYYSVIDMNQNGGLGAVTQKNIQVNNVRNADCVRAIKHGNGRDWWVISKLTNNTTFHNRFYVYLVSSSGISAPIIQNFQNAQDCDAQQFVFNPEGSKLMLTNQRGFMAEYDFDRCTGIVSNPNIIYTEQSGPYTRYFFEGAYSPDGHVFYISSIWNYAPQSDTSRVLQFDLNSPNIVASSDTLFYIKHPVIGGLMRLAPDNKIYYACGYDFNLPNGYPYPDSVRNMYNENLGIVNFPDSLGNACDFQPFSYNLGGKRTYWGLPNNPDYSLGPWVGSLCDTLGVGMEEIEINMEPELFVFYHHGWQKLFVNAKNINGKNCFLEIFDMNGRSVYLSSKMARASYYTANINCSAFENGMYVISLLTERQKITKKFIKN